MNITIDQSALSRELALLAGAAAKSSSIPILSHVRMEATGDALCLTATDLECGITASVPAQVKAYGAVCLPVQRLLSYVRLLPAGEVKIAVSDTMHATVTGGRSRSRIPGMAADSFPELPTAPAPIVTLPARGLVKHLAAVKHCISQADGGKAPNAALVDFADGKCKLTALDGNRLAYLEVDAATEPLKLMATVLIINQYSKVADASDGEADAGISQDDNHLFFTVGPRTLIARKRAGNFPDVKRILCSRDGGFPVSRDELKLAIERVQGFAANGKNVSPTVKVEFTEGQVTVSAASIDAGESDESFPCEYHSKDVAMGMNPTYLIDFLAWAQSDTVETFVSGPAAALEMRADGVRFIAMPKRI